MKWRPPAVPPGAWLTLAIACFVAAFIVWQDQRLDRLRPPTTSAAEAAPPPRATASEPPAPAQPAPPERAGEPGANAGAGVAATGNAAASEATTIVRPPDPLAGRQVLRCVSRGRVTYRDLNAGCPEGATETITVFPTEGVGKPQ